MKFLICLGLILSSNAWATPGRNYETLGELTGEKLHKVVYCYFGGTAQSIGYAEGERTVVYRIGSEWSAIRYEIWTNGAFRASCDNAYFK